MSGFEFNKIAAAILVAGLIAMISGSIARGVYTPDTSEGKRGYQVEIAVAGTANAASSEPEALDISALMAVADAAKGKKVAKKCAACHTFDSAGANKVGPNLYGIVGNKMAANDDFNYSKVLSAKSEGWDYDNLFAFLKSPKKFMKGTKMSFIGLKKSKDIANIIAYLREQSATVYPLP